MNGRVPALLSVFAVAMAGYGWGSPRFDGARPQIIDRQLRGYHAAVNTIARDTGTNIVRVQERVGFGIAAVARDGFNDLVAARTN